METYANGQLKNHYPALSASDYFLLRGMFNALPAHWKSTLRCHNMENVLITPPKESPTNPSTSKNSVSKKTDWDKIGTIALKPTAQIKFQELYQNFDFRWNEIYTRPCKKTIDCKTREFSTRILR